MPELTVEQREALAKQKENCPFCKIIAGEIPSKQVYEDDEVIALLDIHPAIKGHILVMPKEHYPIMPLIPEKTFTHLFKIVSQLSEKLKKSMLVAKTSIFIANGYIAGQNSQHFLLHVMNDSDNTQRIWQQSRPFQAPGRWLARRLLSFRDLQ